MNTSRRLARSNTDRIIGGVAGGIANYLNIDPTLVRLAFVLLVLVGGVSPLIYLILWAVLPNENTLGQGFSQQVRSNIAEMEQTATNVASQVSNQIGQFTSNKPSSQSNPSQQTPGSGQSNPSQQTPGSGQSQDPEGPATGPTTRL